MNMTIEEFRSNGGKARAKKYSKEQLSEWGKRGGRPRLTKTTKRRRTAKRG